MRTAFALIRVLSRGGDRRFFLSLLASGSQRRYAVDWARSLRPDYLLDEPSPWITFGAICEIRGRVRANWRVFEYGSGGSTLFWRAFAGSCVSIEHDPQWHERLRVRLGSAPGVDYRLVAPEATGEGPADPSDPSAYASDDPAFSGCSFRKYVSQIDSFPDGHFDVVLIDGRARPSCIMHAAPKVKAGGLLVLDNADRAYYTAQARRFLRDYRASRFAGAVPAHNEFNATDIYVRMR